METEEAKEKTNTRQAQDKKTEKTWHEKLFDSISGNTEILKSLIAFLSNPFVLAGGMVAFVCWIFKSKENKESLHVQNQELRFELGILHKKYKKIKKKCRKMEENVFAENSTKQNFNFFKSEERPEKNRPNQNNNSGSAFLI